MSERHKTWGWDGTASEFLEARPQSLEEALADYSQLRLHEDPEESQVVAWRNSIRLLKVAIAEIVAELPEALTWHLVFEYELPRERGRRPDLVLLAGPRVIVLEFKEYEAPTLSHVDQVEAYARDLAEYHAATHGHDVIPILVLSKAREDYPAINAVTIASPAELKEKILRAAGDCGAADAIDTDAWLIADYAPLPSLVAAARMVFEHNPLPPIGRAIEAGIPQALEALATAAAAAASNGEKHLAFVTGAPGAGKTMVGLQFVYANHFSDDEAERAAVFLSGNLPLVKVLQYTLHSSVFVQDVLGFLRRYGGENLCLPSEHIWVFDEAQRAFDAEMAREKRGTAISEPADFLGLGDRLSSWALMVGLIGEGQEINRGEEAGIEQWNEALARMPGEWIVHSPARISCLFTHARNVIVDDSLNLTVNLRSHRAENVHEWVNALLCGDLDRASQLAHDAKAQGFEMYVTRDPDAARLYVRDRYASEPNKRFGLLASAKAKNVAFYGFMNIFQYTQRMRLGPWFDDPPTSMDSCCSLRETATEFQVQGLELDMPVVGWGDDLWWENNEWRTRRSARSKMKDPHQIRLNAYRVLLTRGRDGIVVFVPNEPDLHATYGALVRSGLNPMQRVWLRETSAVLLPEDYRHNA